MKRKIEYILVILIACALSEFALFTAWVWFWSGFQWSPFGYETCGLEVLVFWFFTWPGLILGLTARNHMQMGVLMMDLDDFKLFNECGGHQT